MLLYVFSRKVQSLLAIETLSIGMLSCAFLVACSNSTPEVHSNSPAPTVASKGITISDLEAAAYITGTCAEIGKLEKGFDLQIDGSTWIHQLDVTCTNGAFRIRVEKLGREMQFQNRIRATKNARVRRSSLTGKTSETMVAVHYVPDVGSGGLTEGGGVATVSGKYILRGSFNATRTEATATAVSTDSKFRMRLSRDKDVL